MKRIVFGVFFLMIVAVFAYGRWGPLPVGQIPDEWKAYQYDHGLIVTELNIKRGDLIFQDLEALLDREKGSGWAFDIVSIAPRTYFRSSSMSVNCTSRGLTVNYAGALGEHRWIQKSKRIPNIKCPILKK